MNKSAKVVLVHEAGGPLASVLDTSDAPPLVRQPTHRMLATNRLSITFSGLGVVNEVSLSIRRGDVVGLIGPSGAGKTMIFNMLAGIVRPDSGAVMLDGTDISRMALFERARRGLSYLAQQPSIFKSLTVEQNMLIVLEAQEVNAVRRRAMLNRLLDEFGIAGLRDQIGARLSGGERRRCEIARAMSGAPRYLLLDEPFAGVDPIAVGDLRQLIWQVADRGVGVLITDHNAREMLSLVDRAYILEAGSVLAHGTPKELVLNSAVRRLYLGTDFRF